jgi:hypothetical protein
MKTLPLDFNFLNARFVIDESSPSGLKTKTGRNVGYKNKEGYWKTTIKKKQYAVHRIIYVLRTKEDPKDLEVHHVVFLDNSGELIATTTSNNRLARRSHRGSSRYKGVHWFKPRNRWKSQLRVNGKIIHSRTFKTEQEAALDYNEACEKYVEEKYWVLNNVK